jgi:hypothetical protein
MAENGLDEAIIAHLRGKKQGSGVMSQESAGGRPHPEGRASNDAGNNQKVIIIMAIFTKPIDNFQEIY